MVCPIPQGDHKKAEKTGHRGMESDTDISLVFCCYQQVYDTLTLQSALS